MIMALLNLNNTNRIESTTLAWVLQKLQTVENKKTKLKEKQWVNQTWHSTLCAACEFYVEQTLRDSSVEGVEAILKKLDAIHRDIQSVLFIKKGHDE